MKNNGVVFIKEIDRELAKELCIKNHYSRKWNSAFGRFNFGIFKESEPDRCLGVAVFGNMMNPNSYKSINSKIERANITELNRLWIDDELGYNTETVFMSLCFKYFKHYHKDVKIVQSFADGRLGCGTIYKASNFKYYGYHRTLFHENIYTKEAIHQANLNNTKGLPKMIGENIGYIRGYLGAFYVKTFRYIYYLDREYEKYSLLKEQPYPEYSKGMDHFNFEQTSHVLARCMLGCKLLGLNDLSDEFYQFLTDNFDKEQVELSLQRAAENQSLIEYINEKQHSYVTRVIAEYNEKYAKLPKDVEPR